MEIVDKTPSLSNAIYHSTNKIKLVRLFRKTIARIQLLYEIIYPIFFYTTILTLSSNFVNMNVIFSVNWKNLRAGICKMLP